MSIRYHGGAAATTIRRQRTIIRRLYIVAAALAIGLIALWLISSAAHRRDVSELNKLNSANVELKSENDQLHRINKELGTERDEAIKWLESIQPGINFDGI